MVFPSVYLGVVIATAADLLLDGVSLSAMVATGIAAAVAGVMRLPFTGVLLALLLCAGAGLAVTTPAIVGAVVGVLVRGAADTRLKRDEPQDAQPAPVG
jgi:H+/Cl- antiporter ClcA